MAVMHPLQKKLMNAAENIRVGFCWQARPALRYVLGGLFLLLVMLCPIEGYCQVSGAGSIQGTVTDSSGAAIPNAQVAITEEATQVTHTSSTNKSGLYSFPDLKVGAYTIRVAAQGFEKYKQTRIVLEVGSSIAINVSMTVGHEDVQVEVHANNLALQKEDTGFKQVIDEKTIEGMPLDGRQVTELITLAGAAVDSSALNGGSKGWWSSVSPQIAGGQGNQTDYRLDGADNNDWSTNSSFAFPFPDALSQFSVQTSTLAASSGLHPAGVVNSVTRSGTNQWHGGLFEFVRNDIIDASHFFSRTKDELHQNQYGGTFGGRVIPDKLFFFVGYQRLDASSSSATKQAQVPTAANMLGDFSTTSSAACQANGTAIQMLNPITGAVLGNNQISTSYFNSSALALQKYLPPTTDPCGWVYFAIPTIRKENEIVTRIDYNPTSRHTLYGRYFFVDYVNPAASSITNILTSTQPGANQRAQSLTLSDIWVATPSMVNTIHLTGTRRAITRISTAVGLNAASLGVNAWQGVAAGLYVTSTKFNIGCSTCALATVNVNALSVMDDVNWVVGKHMVMFGAELIHAQLNTNNVDLENGLFSFGHTFSQLGPAQNSHGGTGGDSNLDFLTGSMTYFEQSPAVQNSMSAPIPSLYFQDTYRASARLTLTAGMRWGAEYVPADRHGKGSAFDMNAFTANEHSAVYPNAPAGTFYWGDKGIPKNYVGNQLWEWSPRLGLIFDPTGKGQTVVRLGASSVYDETNFLSTAQTTTNAPFTTQVQNTATTEPINMTNPWAGGTVGSNPFPMPYPTSTFVFPKSVQYVVSPSVSQRFSSPLVMQWSVSLQQQLPSGWQFQLYYMGNATRHMPYSWALDLGVYIPGVWTGPGSCGALTVSPGNNQPCSNGGNLINRERLALINPTQAAYYAGGGNGSMAVASGANASYNALVTTIQHRFYSNFTFMANYTWSHCLDELDTPGQFNLTYLRDPSNPRLDYGNCGFDHRNMVNAYFVATSHFSLKGWERLVANNWVLSPIARWRSGGHFDITTGDDQSMTHAENDHPDYNGISQVYTGRHPVQLNTSSNNVYVNSSAFTINAVGTFGNLARNRFIGPSSFTLDTALSRIFPLNRKLSMSLRLEAFNVLNHPVFSNPSSGEITSTTNFGRITSSSSPRVFQGAVKFKF